MFLFIPQYIKILFVDKKTVHFFSPLHKKSAVPIDGKVCCKENQHEVCYFPVKFNLIPSNPTHLSFMDIQTFLLQMKVRTIHQLYNWPCIQFRTFKVQNDPL